MKTTTCSVCGTSVNYATKKPKFCAKHRAPKQYRKKKSIPQVSKKELQMKQLLNQILPEAVYIDNGYYSFLLSPKKSPLQLDRYYPDLKLAFEFDGSQHSEYNPFMHSSQAAFQYLQECDALKDYLCKKLGIRLIRIKHDKKLTKAYLIERLRAESILEELKRKTEVVE